MTSAKEERDLFDGLSFFKTDWVFVGAGVGEAFEPARSTSERTASQASMWWRFDRDAKHEDGMRAGERSFISVAATCRRFLLFRASKDLSGGNQAARRQCRKRWSGLYRA